MTSAPGGRILFMIAVAGVLLSGCRTYGGHGTESATYLQIQQAHQIFQEDLARKQADLSRLEAAAAESGELERLAEQYAQIVRGQEAVAAVHSDLLANLSADSDYRRLHRVFGAVVTQHNTIRMQYEGLLWNAHRAFTPEDSTVRAGRPYSLIPPYYKRIEEQERRLSVNEILALARSGSVPGVQSAPGVPGGAQFQQASPGATSQEGSRELSSPESTEETSQDGSGGGQDVDNGQ